MLTVQPAKNLHGRLDLPPSSDLFVLASVVSLARRRPILVSPPIDTPFLRKWAGILERHARFEWSGEGCLVTPIAGEDPALRVGLGSFDTPWRELVVFSFLGMGKTVVFSSVTDRRIDALQRQAQRLGFRIQVERFDSSTCLSIVKEETNRLETAPEPLSENDLHPLLGLLLGSCGRRTFTFASPPVSPLRSLAAAFGFSIEVKSMVPRERDPLVRRLQLLRHKNQHSGQGQLFSVIADFSPSDSHSAEAPLAITLPGDGTAGAAFTAARCLFPKSSLVIGNYCLETWATPLLALVRKMGGKVSVQETGRTSFGSVGILHIQVTALSGKKMECVPALQYIPVLPAMVVIAAFAEGESVFRDLADLRDEDPDGIALIESCIRILGARHGSMPDGIVLKGGRDFDGFDLSAPVPAACAAAFGMAALRCIGATKINDELLAERLPHFDKLLQQVCEYRV